MKWETPEEFGAGLKEHLATGHGIYIMSGTPANDITAHLKAHHKPGVPADEFFPYEPCDICEKDSS